MKLSLLALAAAFALPSLAAADPIVTRQALMNSVAAAAGVAAGVQKGEVAYSPAIGKSALNAAAAAALAFGDFFPEGSDTGDTRAAPRIWQDRAAFDAELARFEQSALAAAGEAGRDGPAEAAAFVEAMKPVMGGCRSCHESFRLAQ